MQTPKKSGRLYWACDRLMCGESGRRRRQTHFAPPTKTSSVKDQSESRKFSYTLNDALLPQVPVETVHRLTPNPVVRLFTPGGCAGRTPTLTPSAHDLGVLQINPPLTIQPVKTADDIIRLARPLYGRAAAGRTRSGVASGKSSHGPKPGVLNAGKGFGTGKRWGLRHGEEFLQVSNKTRTTMSGINHGLRCRTSHFKEFFLLRGAKS